MIDLPVLWVKASTFSLKEVLLRGHNTPTLLRIQSKHLSDASVIFEQIFYLVLYKKTVEKSITM